MVAVKQKNPRQLSVPDRHQLRILLSNFKYVPFMRSHSLAETRRILKDKFGYSDSQIKALDRKYNTTNENPVTKKNSATKTRLAKKNVAGERVANNGMVKIQRSPKAIDDYYIIHDAGSTWHEVHKLGIKGVLHRASSQAKAWAFIKSLVASDKKKNPKKGFEKQVDSVNAFIKTLPVAEYRRYAKAFLWHMQGKKFALEHQKFKIPSNIRTQINNAILDITSSTGDYIENSTSTRTEVRSPTRTATSTEAETRDNVTVTGGAGAGATTKVTIIKRNSAKRNPKIVEILHYKGFLIKKDSNGHYLVYRKDSEYPFAKSVNLAYAKKNIERLLTAKGKRNTTTPLPDDRKVLANLQQWLKSGIPTGSAKKDLEEKIQELKRRLSKTGLTKHRNNATASDFKQHQTKRLSSLAKMFQGVANGQQKRVLESDYTPKDKYRLGYLVQLKIKDGGKVIPINFDGEAYLAADLKNNLLIVGKDSRIDNIKLPPQGQLKYLGELIQVDYITAKKHIEQGKTVRFYHKLGEVTKEMPNLFIDSDGFPIIIGGAFDIWDVGIVN